MRTKIDNIEVNDLAHLDAKYRDLSKSPLYAIVCSLPLSVHEMLINSTMVEFKLMRYWRMGYR